MTTNVGGRARDRSRRHLPLIPFLLALAAAGSATSAHALAFGAMRVLSAPGQALQAEVELLDVRQTPLAARALPPSQERDRAPGKALADDIQTDIVQLADGRHVLRLSSSQPIAQAALKLALQVDDGEGLLARDFSLALASAGQRGAAAAPQPAPAVMAPMPQAQTAAAREVGRAPAAPQPRRQAAPHVSVAPANAKAAPPAKALAPPILRRDAAPATAEPTTRTSTPTTLRLDDSAPASAPATASSSPAVAVAESAAAASAASAAMALPAAAASEPVATTASAASAASASDTQSTAAPTEPSAAQAGATPASAESTPPPADDRAQPALSASLPWYAWPLGALALVGAALLAWQRRRQRLSNAYVDLQALQSLQAASGTGQAAAIKRPDASSVPVPVPTPASDAARFDSEQASEQAHDHPAHWFTVAHAEVAAPHGAAFNPTPDASAPTSTSTNGSNQTQAAPESVQFTPADAPTRTPVVEDLPAGLAYAQALLDQGRHAEAAASARDIVDMCDTLAAELAADHKKIQP